MSDNRWDGFSDEELSEMLFAMRYVRGPSTGLRKLRGELSGELVSRAQRVEDPYARLRAYAEDLRTTSDARDIGDKILSILEQEER